MSEEQYSSEYDKYNREERNLCAHLFRLLHEEQFLCRFLARISRNLEARALDLKCIERAAEKPRKLRLLANAIKVRDLSKPVRIYMEVALLRDMLHELYKEQPTDFFQHGTRRDRLEAFRPGGVSAQGLLAAKPDMVIAHHDFLIVIEAKFTTGLGEDQWKFTQALAELWRDRDFWCSGDTLPCLERSPLEWLDVHSDAPASAIFLGANRLRGDSIYEGIEPHITWEDVCEVARGGNEDRIAGPRRFPESDRSLVALQHAKELLAKLGPVRKRKGP